MPFPAALSGANQTTKRQGGNFQAFLVVHTPSVKLKFQPSVAALSNVSGEIQFSTTLSGAYTNVLLGMTVIISPTSDYAADLRNQPQNCFVTYVRAAAGAFLLKIGQTKFQFTTSNYVTVLDDYRVFERKIRVISATDIRRDYEILWRKPKPRIYGLYAQAVFASGASASISFTPSAECMASSGSISSWLWNVADGTITSGSTTTQNITASFPVGTRNVHLSVTDSNGISSYLTALIVVVPSNLSSVIHLEEGSINISKSLESGNSAEFVTFANGSFLDGSQALIACHALYADGTSTLSTLMTGWLKDVKDNLSASNNEGVTKEMSGQVQGLSYYAAQIQSDGFFTELKTTPAIWGEFGRLTPYDCLWYVLSEHSTIPNVAALDYPSNHTNFKFTEINIPSGTMLDVANTLAFRCLGGSLNFSPNGELVLRQSLLYATSSSDRNAATTYASYTTDDSYQQDLSRIANAEIKPVGQVLLGCAVYNTTTKIPRVYYSKAPAGDESGYLIEELDGVLLEANTTDANSRTTAGAFTANHYFAINENPVLNAALVDGYYTLEPSSFNWHKFTLDTLDTVSSALLTTSDRFICTELSLNFSNDSDNFGRIEVSATFRKETDGGTNYLQETGYVPTNQPNVQPFVPQYLPLPFLDTGLESEDTYDSDSNDSTGGDNVQDPTLPPAQSGEAMQPSSKVLATVLVPMFANTVVYSPVLANGQAYIFRVTGDAKLNSERHQIITDWSKGSQLGFSLLNDGTFDLANWAGDGWTSLVGGGGFRYITFKSTFAWPANCVFTQVTYYIQNQVDPVVSNGVFGMPAPLGVPTGSFGATVTDGVNVVNTDIVLGARTGLGITYIISPANSSKVWKAVWEYTGDAPGLSGEAVTLGGDRGDAFYWKYNNSDEQEYPASTGLTINGAFPTKPSYSPSHSYDMPFTGTGVDVPFQFFDPENVYPDNDNSYLRIEIIQV